MFDIGFVELLICSIIALLVLGPERLPAAARATGRWVGGARRMVSQFTSELDRQLKAEELREELRKAGDVGLDDVQKTVSDALSEAKQFEHMVVSDETTKRAPLKDSNTPISTGSQQPASESDQSQDSTPESRT